MSIIVNNLSKHFGTHVVVNRLSFEVKEGEVLGFLGPNGAGKSTTMKMLTGFLEPTEGEISICGFDVVGKDAIAAKRIIGYLPEGAPAYGEMNVDEFLKFIIAIRRLGAAAAKSGFDNVVAKLGLRQVLYQPIETLSKGFKRRVGLAQALIHDPKVLIMDEPTDGLDPNQKHQVRELITSLTKDKIVIISTHILEEVTAVCTRAMIIAQGKLLIDKNPAELLARSRYYGAVSLQVNDRSVIEEISSLEAVKSVEEERDGYFIVFPQQQAGDSLYSVIRQAAQDRKWDVEDVHHESGRLDEVFRSVTEGSLA